MACISSPPGCSDSHHPDLASSSSSNSSSSNYDVACRPAKVAPVASGPWFQAAMPRGTVACEAAPSPAHLAHAARPHASPGEAPRPQEASNGFHEGKDPQSTAAEPRSPAFLGPQAFFGSLQHLLYFLRHSKYHAKAYPEAEDTGISRVAVVALLRNMYGHVLPGAHKHVSTWRMKDCKALFCWPDIVAALARAGFRVPATVRERPFYRAWRGLDGQQPRPNLRAAQGKPGTGPCSDDSSEAGSANQPAPHASHRRVRRSTSRRPRRVRLVPHHHVDPPREQAWAVVMEDDESDVDVASDQENLLQEAAQGKQQQHAAPVAKVGKQDDAAGKAVETTVEAASKEAAKRQETAVEEGQAKGTVAVAPKLPVPDAGPPSAHPGQQGPAGSHSQRPVSAAAAAAAEKRTQEPQPRGFDAGNDADSDADEAAGSESETDAGLDSDTEIMIIDVKPRAPGPQEKVAPSHAVPVRPQAVSSQGPPPVTAAAAERRPAALSEASATAPASVAPPAAPVPGAMYMEQAPASFPPTWQWLPASPSNTTATLTQAAAHAMSQAAFPTATPPFHPPQPQVQRYAAFPAQDELAAFASPWPATAAVTTALPGAPSTLTTPRTRPEGRMQHPSHPHPPQFQQQQRQQQQQQRQQRQQQQHWGVQAHRTAPAPAGGTRRETATAHARGHGHPSCGNSLCRQCLQRLAEQAASRKRQRIEAPPPQAAVTSGFSSAPRSNPSPETRPLHHRPAVSAPAAPREAPVPAATREHAARPPSPAAPVSHSSRLEVAALTGAPRAAPTSVSTNTSTSASSGTRPPVAAGTTSRKDADSQLLKYIMDSHTAFMKSLVGLLGRDRGHP